MFKDFAGGENFDKSFVTTEDSSSINLWLERLCIMFLLYWEAYVLMDLVVNLWDSDLDWFYRKTNFIDGGVYMRFSGGAGLAVTSSFFI